MNPKRSSGATEILYVLPLKNGRSIEVLANQSRASVRKLTPKETEGTALLTVSLSQDPFKSAETLRSLEDLCKVIHATDFKVDIDTALLRSPKLFELMTHRGFIAETRQFLRTIQSLKSPLFPYIHALGKTIAGRGNIPGRVNFTKLLLEFMDPAIDHRNWFEGGSSQFLATMARQLNQNGSYPFTNSRGYAIGLSQCHVQCIEHLITGGFDATELMRLPLRADISNRLQQAIWKRERRILSIQIPMTQHHSSTMRL